ncbi:MAG: hypothetical protein R2795_23625 [Saprospiraceae bacterium]
MKVIFSSINLRPDSMVSLSWPDTVFFHPSLPIPDHWWRVLSTDATAPQRKSPPQNAAPLLSTSALERHDAGTRYRVSGSIRDENGEPLIFASVRIPGTSIGGSGHRGAFSKSFLPHLFPVGSIVYRI